jgi:hypothetical protein
MDPGFCDWGKEMEKNHNRAELIEYLTTMSECLAKVARDAGLETLAHLFDMAALEAGQLQQRGAGS